jgi:hypothetical protein
VWFKQVGAQYMMHHVHLMQQTDDTWNVFYFSSSNHCVTYLIKSAANIRKKSQSVLIMPWDLYFFCYQCPPGPPGNPPPPGAAADSQVAGMRAIIENNVRFILRSV